MWEQMTYHAVSRARPRMAHATAERKRAEPARACNAAAAGPANTAGLRTVHPARTNRRRATRIDAMAEARRAPQILPQHFGFHHGLHGLPSPPPPPSAQPDTSMFLLE